VSKLSHYEGKKLNPKIAIYREYVPTSRHIYHSPASSVAWTGS
jgi:hypothetical protein